MSQSDTHGLTTGTPSAVIDSEEPTYDIEVPNTDILLALTGAGSERLILLGRELGISIGLRGNVIRLQGPKNEVDLAQRLLDELVDVIKRGAQLADLDVLYSVRTLREHPEVKLRDLFEHVVVTAGRGRQITPKGIAQKRYIQAIRDYDVVFGVGPAGTGKTYLAMGMAVAAFQERRVSRIILTRPAVEAGEKLGFLPGDLAEKVNPYLRPLYDALHDMMPVEKVFSLIERGTIEVAPLAFMRGRTLNDCFVILDEAQNTTVAQMKMFLTRLGVCSKAVVAGDVTQVDLDKNVPSGLLDAVELLKDVDGIQCCYFSEADVVRHPLVQRIVEVYDSRDTRRKKETDIANDE